METVIQEVKQDKDIIVIQSKTKEIVQKAHSLAICDEGSQKLGTDILSFVKKAYRNLETKRKVFTQPILDAKKNIDDEFKAMTIPLKEAEQVIKEKLLSYHQELRQKAEEEAKEKAKKNEEVAKKLNLPKVETKPEEVPNQAKGTIGTSYIQKRWTFELTDKEEVPREYLMLDNVSINNAIKAGVREIPGLRIYQKETIGGK